MNELIGLVKRMLEDNNVQEQMKIEHNFLEKLAFSDFEEILELLDMVDKNYWLEFPIWARLISYRLLCLYAPSDATIKRRVAAGLLSFGPDWDLEAEKLQKEADRIEKL